MPTKIGWVINPDGTQGEVWNPVTGCTKVSQGCKHCYAESVARRFWKGRSFGDVQCHADRLEQPLHWRKPRRAFVNSMSDLFHPDVPFDFIDQVFAVMALCPQHTFQILTKRPERMGAYFNDPIPLSTRQDMVAYMHPTRINGKPFTWGEPMASWQRGAATDPYDRRPWPGWPLPNIHLGVSVEDQATADERIPHLLRCPAAVRFVSAEPLLGAITHLPGINQCQECGGITWWGENLHDRHCLDCGEQRHPIDWLICGGESGPHARPMHPDWARGLRDQCQEAGVPYFFKQWGGKDKKAAGRVLDGRTWDEFPKDGAK